MITVGSLIYECESQGCDFSTESMADAIAHAAEQTGHHDWYVTLKRPGDYAT